MQTQEELIETLLDELKIPKLTKAGAEFSLFGRVSLLAERASKAGKGCLCSQADETKGGHHSVFCPLYKQRRSAPR